MNIKNWGGVRKGAGRLPLNSKEKRNGVKIYITEKEKLEILKYGNGKSFSEKAISIINSEIQNRKDKKL